MERPTDTASRLPDLRAPVIVLHAGALATIEAHAQESVDGLETGGILLGHDQTTHIDVTVAGGPGPSAVRQATWFLRDLDHAKHLGDIAYDADGSIWVGEWHTHPRGPVAPSALDLRTYAQMLDDTELDFARFVALILTPGPSGWTSPLLWPWVMTADRETTLATIRVQPRPPADGNDGAT